MCVYNASDYLQETLDSLKEQTYQNIKYLFINDGSTDDSLKILEEFSKEVKDCKIVNLEKNSGTAVARNRAINEADTGLMMFFDSDDVAKPELVAALYKKIKETEKCIAVSCYAQYISDKGKKLKGGMFMGEKEPEKFIKKAKEGKLSFMVPATLFYRQKAIEAGGYRLEGFPKGEIRYQDLSEDLDLWSRMSDYAQIGECMIVEPKVLYYYRKRANSLSAPKEKQYAMTLKIKYIKQNLRNRRSDRKEITFIQFLEDLTEKEQKKIRRGFNAEYYYRKAAFNFVDHKFLTVIPNIIISVVYKPSYLLQKFKANFKK